MRILIFLAATLLIGGIAFACWLINFRIKISRYGKRLRNFYVFSEHPNDRSLVTRAKEHELWLKRAQNKSDVKVLIIPFQDKLHPLESWEEYLVRRKEEQRLDMIERDTEIEKKKGREYYLREIHEQSQDVPPDMVDTIQDIQDFASCILASLETYRIRLREAKRSISQKVKQFRPQ